MLCRPAEPDTPRTLDAVRLGLALDTSAGLAGAMLAEISSALLHQVRCCAGCLFWALLLLFFQHCPLSCIHCAS